MVFANFFAKRKRTNEGHIHGFDTGFRNVDKI